MRVVRAILAGLVLAVAAASSNGILPIPEPEATAATGLTSVAEALSLVEETFASDFGHGEGDEDDDGCGDSACLATFNSYGRAVDMKCSLASGHVTHELPLAYPGNPDLCRTFEEPGNAHFCTITTDYIFAPFVGGKGLPTGGAFPLGPLHLGRCVSKQCTAERLKARFIKKLARLGAVMEFKTLSPVIPWLTNYIRNGTRVRCEDEDAKAQEHQGSIGFRACVALLITLMVLVALATLLDAQGKRGILVESFSFTQSLTGLVQPSKGGFAVLNGARVISMAYIIYGHTVLLSSVSMDIPVFNPSIIDWEVRSTVMAVVMGGEFAVDTFFMLSGFLAMFGLVTSDSPPTSVLGFGKLVILRYVRLSPVYFSLMLAFIYVLPHAGSGPYFYENAGYFERNYECAYAWTNLLYVNNLVPSSDRAGTRSCMGHSWYLAVDFQLFVCLLPFLASFHLWVRRHKAFFARPWTWWACAFAPHCCLIITQIAITYDRVYRLKDYYVQPYCRMTPYVVGCALACFIAENDAVAVDKEWLQPILRGARGLLLGLLGLAVSAAIVFSVVDNIRCDAEVHSDCSVWASMVLWGATARPRWSKAGESAYIAFSYLGWSLALVAMSLFAFAERGGWITRVLSHPVFTPLARLTYGAYLLHVVIQIQMYAQVTAPLYISPYKQVGEALAFVVVSYAASFFMYVLVERPMMRFIPLVLGLERGPGRRLALNNTTGDASNHEEFHQPLLRA